MANPHPTNRTPPAIGRWKPGQSGNPSGLSKAKRYQMAIESALTAMAVAHDGNKDPQKTREQIAAVHIGLALAGDMSAIKELYDREDGKIAQALIGSADEPPIAVSAIVRTIVEARDTDSQSIQTST